MEITFDKWQQEFLDTEGDKILCTGRQVGKSVVCGKDAGEYAVKNPKKVVLMIAPTERQAYALFEKTLSYLVENYPKHIKKKGDKPTKTKITLTNKTQIYCLPVGLSGLVIRFLTVHRLYADEASRIPDDVWTAVTPSLLTTGGDSIYLSTPAGKQGEFYRCWVNEDDAFSSFSRFSIDSHKVISERPICGSWTEEQRDKGILKIKQAQKRMSSLEYMQEYMGEFVEALTQLYPDKMIKGCMLLPNDYVIHGDMFLGVDIARLGGDDTVLCSVDRVNKQTLNVVAIQIFNKIRTTETTANIIAANARHNYKKIYIDSAGVGGGVLDQLLIHDSTKRKVEGIENVRKSIDNEEKRKKKTIKEDLYLNLRELMEKGQISFPEETELFQSLKSIQYEYTDEGNIKIFGKYTHIAEALIRACWCIKDKGLNIYIF